MVEQDRYDAMKEWADYMMAENSQHRRMASDFERKYLLARYFAVSGWLMCAISIFLFYPFP